MTLSELNGLCIQASGDGILVDCAPEAVADAVTVRMRRQSTRTGQWLAGSKKFTTANLDSARGAICEMAAALAHEEMKQRIPEVKVEARRRASL